jgi:hypothetical protein
VSLGLPAGWLHVNPRDANEVRRLTSLLDDQVLRLRGSTSALEEEQKGVEEEIVRSVIHQLAIAGHDGVTLYAWWADAVRTGNFTTIVMAAAVLAVVATPTAGTRDQDMTALSLLARSDEDEAPSGQTPRRSLVDLAGGTALRACRSSSRSMPGNAPPLRQAIVQYILPVLGVPSVAVLTFATPSLQYADQLQPMFDSIASTLAVTPRAGASHAGA